MSATHQHFPDHPAGLAWFAKAVVGAVFVLIFIGGLVTSWGAGMSVPDWPLSFGSINPTDWWHQFPVRLEHGHRLFAMLVGLLTGILCAWIWGRWKALLVAAIVSGTVPTIFHYAGAADGIVMHLRIWPAAVAFLIVLLTGSRGKIAAHSPTVRWLAVAAFICVCIQATLGGLRVTQETAGLIGLAQVLRIVHGSFAQAYLVLVVSIATLLSRRALPSGRPEGVPLGRCENLAWVTVAAIYLQLVVGATMRHLGAGLAIPTFPQATAAGGWLPDAHNAYVDLNFTHTRFGAVVISLLILGLIGLVLRRAKGEPLLKRPALLLGALLFTQVILGMFVIWHLKPRTLTTVHVVTGALLLSTAVLLALRIRLSRNCPASLESDLGPGRAEVSQ